MMLSLGLFIFETNSAAYQTLQRSAAWRFGSGKRLGKRPLYQNLGPGDETITLSGVLYPELTGGKVDLEKLREMMATGKAFTLVSGDGDALGLWLIMEISETSSLFFQDGTARKIEFTLKITRIDDDQVDQMGELL